MKRKRCSPRSAARDSSHPGAPGSARRGNCISIDVVNQQRVARIHKSKIESVVRIALRSEGVKSARIDLALVDDTTIRDVHRRFLRQDSPTDVLTFPLHEPNEPLSGQIVLSVETAARVGPVHGFTAQEEVLLYAIHGILHLCGYDDQSPRDARRMRRRQELLLRKALHSI